MVRPLILYLHGFGSSSRSWKAEALAQAMAERGWADRFFCPDLPPVPSEALAVAEEIIGKTAERNLTLVGSSLGGHYATWLAEKHALRAVLVNPAVIPRAGTKTLIGEHRHYHTGEPFCFTQAHADQLVAQSIARPKPDRYLLLVETGDEVLDYRDAVAHYAACRQILVPGGDHSFTKFLEFIPQILEFAGL